MIIELHDHFEQPRRLSATRALVLDRFGAPVALILQMATGHIRVLDAADDDFPEQLQRHGIAQTSVIYHVSSAAELAADPKALVAVGPSSGSGGKNR